MPISKKDRVRLVQPRAKPPAAANTHQIQREHKKADKEGTRAAVKANGLPVKAPKPTSIVRHTLSLNLRIAN